MITLKKARVALLAVPMLVVTTAYSGSTSPASSATAGGSGTPARNSVVPTTTSTSDKIKATGTLEAGVKVDVPDSGLKDTKTDEVESFEIDPAKTIAKSLLGDESKIETQAVTTKTRDPLLDDGEVDLVTTTFTITDGHKEVYNFSDPRYSNAAKLMVGRDSSIKSLKGLDGRTTSAARSSTSMKAIQDAAGTVGMEMKSDECTIYPGVRATLDSGRVQCFSVDGSILSGYVDDATTALDDEYSPQGYDITGRLDSKDPMEYVNGMVAQLKSSGEPDRMIAKWKLNWL